MCTDELDLCAPHPGIRERQPYRLFETTSLGIRSGNMRTIRTTRMAQQISTWRNTALSRCLCTLQNHHTSPLAQQQALAPPVEWSYLITCQRPQVVKATHDKTAQHVHTTGHHGCRCPSTQQVSAYPQTRGPGGTRGRDSEHWSPGCSCQRSASAIPPRAEPITTATRPPAATASGKRAMRVASVAA